MAMQSYQCMTSPLRLFHGPDSLAQLGRELDRVASTRAVIVCGASLARQGMLIDKVRAAMGSRCAGVFAGVKAHSPIPAVQACAEELRRLNADAVVAVGGGFKLSGVGRERGRMEIDEFLEYQSIID